MDSQNAKTAKAFLDENQFGSVSESIRKYCTKDLVWWVSNYGEIQDTIVESIKAMKGFLTGADQKVEVLGVTSEGDRVAMEIESSKPLKNGTVYNNRYHYLFKFRDGRIAEIREYHNTAHARDIWAPLFGQH